jgi:hypothetical protein
MAKSFEHEALSLAGQKRLVYTAFSKHYFYYRVGISRFVLEKGFVPLNPFMLFDYFLSDSVDRDLVREANNSIVQRADEVWVFGPISNGVLAEILLAKSRDKPLLFFKIEKPHLLLPISAKETEMEEEVKNHHHLVF